MQKLRKRFNIRIKRIQDSHRLCRHGNPNQETSAQALVARYLGFYLDKTLQKANYNVKPPLAMSLQLYVMGDAIIHLKLDNVVEASFITAGIQSAEYPPNLQSGTSIIMKIGGV